MKGKNGFEYFRSELKIVQKNGSLTHPQAQGKIKRFHQTLKKWLSEQKADGIFNTLALPGSFGITKVDLFAVVYGEFLVLGHHWALVPIKWTFVVAPVVL